ncbi:MAG TPA: hypothetical protein VJZ49_04485 [Syntrophales bacterium]|nr:hypothetical protein [Syntrophales bacterium]
METKFRKGGTHTKHLRDILISLFLGLVIQGTATASGLFGLPQPASKNEGGLYTGIGYWYGEDRYKNNTEHLTKYHQVYSQVGYGFHNRWEIYGRVGVSDLKIIDAFSSTSAATSTYKNDFEDNLNFSGTLGVKGFYPITKTVGIGAFIQGTYYFRNFTDDVSGTRNAAPFTTELRVKNLWDVNFGIGIQAMVPYGIRVYLGPYIYYSEANMSSSANIPGIDSTIGNITINNKNKAGGFAGIDVPLGRGFHLNVEGQYAERLSAGTAVTYSY